MFAGGRQSFVRQVIFIISPFPTVGCGEDRVNIDTGTAMKKWNKLIAY